MIDPDLRALLHNDDVWDFAMATGRAIVAHYAPAELDLFDEVASSVREDSVDFKHDDVLAFGISQLDLPTTTVVLGLLGAGIKYLLTQLVDSGVDILKDVGKERAKEIFKDRFKRARTGERLPFPGLNPEQIHRLRAEMLFQARRLSIDMTRAEILADATIGRLASLNDTP